MEGNKRTGIAAALTFLELNAIAIEVGTEELVETVESVIRGGLINSGIAELFREHEDI